MKGDYSKIYYRIRKGKYRAIFYFDDDNTILDFIGKREDIYKLWQQSKEQKQMLESISKDNNISLTNTIDYMLEIMENYSDRKIIEELEISKQKQPSREYITADELDILLEKRDRGELTDEDISKL